MGQDLYEDSFHSEEDKTIELEKQEVKRSHLRAIIQKLKNKLWKSIKDKDMKMLYFYDKSHVPSLNLKIKDSFSKFKKL